MAAERGQRGAGRGGTRGRGGRPIKKQDGGASILGAVATPFEWLINQVSRPAYSVGAMVAGDPAAALREMAAFGTLGLSEKFPGMDAPEITVSQALQRRGVDFGDGIPGFLLRFGTDVVTDPTSYVSFGATSVAKGAGRAAAAGARQAAAKEVADAGMRGLRARTAIDTAAEGARVLATREAPKGFAVNFAPLGVTLARRGKPVASKDILFNASKVGRQIEKAVNATSRASTPAQKIFATGGDPAAVNRSVDAMAQTVRRVADRIKGDHKRGLTAAVIRQERRVEQIAKKNKINPKQAQESIGAFGIAQRDAFVKGISVEQAYADIATKFGDKYNLLPLDDLQKNFGRQLDVLPAVARRALKDEIDAGVKTAADELEQYVYMVPRKMKDAGKVEKAAGIRPQSSAIRQATSQQQRVLKSTDDWAKAGLTPEMDFAVLMQRRMNESIDLIAQQTFLNAVSSKFGQVLDEGELLAKLAGKQGKALEKALRAANLSGKAKESADNAASDALLRSTAVDDARAGVAGEKAAGARAVAERERQLGVEEAMQRVFPVAQTNGAVADAGSKLGWTFGEIAQVGSAEAMLRVANREYARRLDDVRQGIEDAGTLRQYAAFVERSKKAVANARTAPKSRVQRDLLDLRQNAQQILRGEKAAREKAVKDARSALRQAKRDGNKVEVQKANARVREAILRRDLAAARADKTAARSAGADKRLAERMRILDETGERVKLGEQVAERTLKTPGARATAEEMRDFKMAGWQQLQFDYESVISVVPPDVKEAVDTALRKAWEVTSNQGTYAQARNFVNGATSRWKGLALISVGYHMRNLQSDLMMAFIAGAKDPRSLPQAVQMLRGRTGSIRVEGGRLSYADVLREADRFGIVRTGEVTQDVGRVAEREMRKGRGVVGKPRVPGEGSLAQGSYRFGRFREDSTRLMLYIERRKAGDTPEEAAAIVRSFLFDYGDTSRFVASTRRFLFPFITWSAKALPRMVKQAVENPRTITRIGFLTDAANESFGGIDPSLLPMGRTMSFAIPTFGMGSGAYTFNPENTLPYGVVNSANPFGFKNAGRSVGTFLNPFVKVPIELATNYNLYQGRTAPRRVAAPVWIRALSGAGVAPSFLDVGDKKDLYTKQSVTGYSRAWDSIFRAFPPYQLAQNYPGVGQESDRIGYLRSTLGVNVSPYERQRDLFYAQKFAPKS